MNQPKSSSPAQTTASLKSGVRRVSTAATAAAAAAIIGTLVVSPLVSQEAMAQGTNDNSSSGPSSMKEVYQDWTVTCQKSAS